jgi:hypothetical protein
MCVIVSVFVIMRVAVVVITAVVTIMAMIMLVVMLVPDVPMRIRRVARVVGEHQRLHRHRHGLRGHADAAEVDVLQIPENDPIDQEQLARQIHLLPKYRPPMSVRCRRRIPKTAVFPPRQFAAAPV